MALRLLSGVDFVDGYVGEDPEVKMVGRSLERRYVLRSLFLGWSAPVSWLGQRWTEAKHVSVANLVTTASGLSVGETVW